MTIDDGGTWDNEFDHDVIIESKSLLLIRTLPLLPLLLEPERRNPIVVSVFRHIHLRARESPE
jgi:hypothetical protein